MLDSKQYLATAFLIEKEHVFSWDIHWIYRSENPLTATYGPNLPYPEPTHFLEPLVPFVTAVGMRINPFFSEEWLFTELLKGEGARAVKMVNLLWVFILLLGTGLLAREVFPPLTEKENKMSFHIIPLLIVFIFLLATDYADRLLSDLPAMALLTWVSFFAFTTWRSRRWSDCFFLGIFWGLLTLTKAVFLYLAPVFVLFIVFGMIFSFLRGGGRFFSWLKFSLIFTIAFLNIVTPWMLRNLIVLGSPELCERGGETLYHRALKNRITETGDEFKGAFYVWTPAEYRPLAGFLLGFTERDMQRGGRAASLNRERADFTDSDFIAIAKGDVEGCVTYYSKTYATMAKLRILEQNINPLAPLNSIRIKIGSELQKQAIGMILQNPGSHLKAVFPFFYRGVWGIAGLGRMGPVLTLKQTSSPESADEKPRGLPVSIPQLLYFILALLSLPCLFLYGVIKDGAYAAFLLPSFLLMGFLAFATHNLPRYNLPVFPAGLISVMVCACFAYKRLRERSHD